MPEVTRTITRTERASRGLAKAVADVAKIISDLEASTVTAISLNEQIEDRQAELDALDKSFDTKQRECAAELRLRTKEDSDAVLRELLEEREFTAVSNEAWASMVADLDAAESVKAEEVSKAVRSAVRDLEAKHRNELAEITAAHRVESAEVNAGVVAKDIQIANLTEQVNELRAQIAAERETRLEIARAESSRQGVVVNAGK